MEPRHLTRALGGRRIDLELLAWLEARTVEVRALSSGAGPRLRTLVDALLHTAIGLIDQDNYPPTVHRRLHTVAADPHHPGSGRAVRSPALQSTSPARWSTASAAGPSSRSPHSTLTPENTSRSGPRARPEQPGVWQGMAEGSELFLVSPGSHNGQDHTGC